MSESMIFTQDILFAAPKDRIWELLTHPDQTEKYMYGCRVLSDWQLSSTISWVGKTEDGQEIVYVKGEVTAITPGSSVSFTMFDPNMGIRDIPENYVNLTYELTESEGGTQLKLIQGDFQGTENGVNRFEESKKGWEMVIPLMQQMIEA